MLTKAPSDPSQDDPQPSTSSSRFCPGMQSGHGPGAPGRRCFLISLCYWKECFSLGKELDSITKVNWTRAGRRMITSVLAPPNQKVY